MNNIVYIPGFGNQDDKIRKSVFPDAKIVQKTMKIISLDKATKYIINSDILELKQKVLDKYPSATVDDFDLMLTEIIKFQGFTRKLSTAISLTKAEIAKVFENECMIKIAGHSQGGLVAIELLIKNPKLLDRIEEIELFAPVVNYSIAKSFHKGKEKGYLNRKGVIVRKQYIDDLNFPEYSLLTSLLIKLRDTNWKGKIKLIYSDTDPVIPSGSLELHNLKMIFPNIQITNTKSDNHYLGY